MPPSLEILIAGAGIAGLAAATALRQAGHKVTVFEFSSLRSEIGAAITIAPNGSRVLAELGFDFDAARGVKMESIHSFDGETLEELGSFGKGGEIREENFGFPHRGYHRVDLHAELKKLALSKGAKLNLGCKVVGVDTETARIKLDDGRTFEGDLLIAADGIHSFIRKACIGEEREAKGSRAIAGNMYRWLLDTETVMKDDLTKGLLRQRARCLYTVPYKEKKLWLAAYPCRNNEIQNYAMFVPTEEGDLEDEDYNASADKAEFLKLCSAFHPAILSLIEKALTIKCWRLRDRIPLQKYTYGSTILIGDAAHPTLPFNAQGGNQALEDAGALLSLFSNLKNGSKEEIKKRMELFDLARPRRAGRQQVISSVPPNEVSTLRDRLEGFEDDNPAPENETAIERIVKELSYNVFARCEEVLKGVS